MDTQQVVTYAGLAVSALAIFAGVEQWLLPARRKRQYEFFTAVRDGETDETRWVALDAIRVRIAARQVGSYWVPAYRIWLGALTPYACTPLWAWIGRSSVWELLGGLLLILPIEYAIVAWALRLLEAKRLVTAQYASGRTVNARGVRLDLEGVLTVLGIVTVPAAAGYMTTALDGVDFDSVSAVLLALLYLGVRFATLASIPVMLFVLLVQDPLPGAISDGKWLDGDAMEQKIDDALNSGKSIIARLLLGEKIRSRRRPK